MALPPHLVTRLGALVAACGVACCGEAQRPIWALNSVGYRPAVEKVATLVGCSSDAEFRVVAVGSEEVVLEGVLAPLGDGEHSLADFSALARPGVYRLESGPAGASPPFEVGEDIWREPFRVALQAMRLWRCGCAVEAEHNGERYQHAACHLDDALTLDGEPAPRDATGGWHDAGDYNKYVVNAGVSVGCLIAAWRDHSDAIEATVGAALLDELRWELDWLLKMQRPDGSVVHKVSTRDFGPFIMPEEEREPRYFSDWGTAATADFVAMVAAGSRVFEPEDPPYAERLRDAALRGHAFLMSHPADKRPDLTPFTTGGYLTRDADERLWALAEVYELTGDPEALEQLEDRIESLPIERRRREAGCFNRNWDWGNVGNLGLLAYLRSEREGRSARLVERLRAELPQLAKRVTTTAERHPFGRPLGDRYYWGSNGGVARQAVLLTAAERVEADPRYAATRRDALNYLFGRNPWGRSFVTGLGHNPPRRPHDRRSGADGVDSPWPGYLVGGPERGPNDWRDEQDDYRTNEIAINWNTALLYALACELPTPNDP